MREAELLAILDAGPLPHAFMTRRQRAAVQAGIDALIDYLDAAMPDADLEDDGCAEPYMGRCETGSGAQPAFEVPGMDECEPDGDGEPSLGSLGGCAGAEWFRQTGWAGGGRNDIEEENEHGGDILDERHDEEEPEPNLGSLHCAMDQRHWSDGERTEREHDDSDLEDDGRRVRPTGGAEPSTLTEAEIRAISGLYAMVCDGDCLEPLLESGAKLVMDPAAPLRHAELVAFWRRCPDGTIRTYIKRLLFHPPGGLNGPELDACWLFEMLNPRTQFPVASRELIAVHAVIGTKKPCGRFDPGLVERNTAFLRAEVVGLRSAGVVS